ncbi:hypothetical protein IHE45_05G119000 [Dioscorea alata]|uniref:Uncharacterized protein n=1 Tax=Dioscorea alata TaxID=55571 RepID=A0ACB7W4M7_DIOAL|nr:hypothetical protein IHE45_05G119000 [Dioscorea alata]
MNAGNRSLSICLYTVVGAGKRPLYQLLMNEIQRIVLLDLKVEILSLQPAKTEGKEKEVPESCTASPVIGIAEDGDNCTQLLSAVCTQLSHH